MNKRLTLPILLLTVWPVAPASKSGSAVVAPTPQAVQVTIHRDEWGVPHVYARFSIFLGANRR